MAGGDVTPPAPRNVRFVGDYGETVPLELVYVGEDDDGFHVWRAAHLPKLVGDHWTLCADTLPARTRVVVAEVDIDRDVPPSRP